MSEHGPTESDGRTRVAILGGGCGGLAAAWRLTATPALRRRFAVTVYEREWRLGGKGASGRAPHGTGNPGAGQRIEEHGLHIWFGFYEHAFRMLREAYAESGLAVGDDWWKVPFQRCDAVSLYEPRPDGSWVRHGVRLPPRGGAHRGPPTEPRSASLARVIARTTRWLATGLRGDLGGPATRRGGGVRGGAEADVADAGELLDEIAAEMDRLQTPLTLSTDDHRGSAGRGAVAATPRITPAGTAGIEVLLHRLRGRTRGLRSAPQHPEYADRARLWSGVLELIAAALTGIVRDEVLWRGFAAIDEEDLRDWLARHGAPEETVQRSPVLRGLYDLTFAYRSGDKRRPSLAAGRGLQALLMMMNYEGSFMWRMRAGMGDVVFAPLYLALRARGVRFEFFSRVTQLRLMPGRPVIGGIELLQEPIRAGVDQYDPLIRIGDWWCWPAQPDREQLTDGGTRLRTLERGVDFESVVLAIPVGALGDICGELAAADARFAQMLAGAKTVRTKAVQVWLDRPPQALRGEAEDGNLEHPATAYAEPFDTYCDMTHLLATEAYGGESRPRGLAYFCAVLPDAIDPADAERTVRAEAQRYLEREARALWPAAFPDGVFDWRVLFDPLDRQGPDRLGAQYFRANVAASDRYVTTPAGSVDSRLDPEHSGFQNLVLAGDWTHSGIDGGCVEAAVISGRRAADALSRPPTGPSPPAVTRGRYVEYGALATAPGPLLCERARLYCFFVTADRARVQRLCDRVLKEPTGGALRYRVPRLHPIVLTFGTIAGLRSLHPGHAGRASASEPEAAIWVPTIAQRLREGRYVDDHLAIFMPYIWVDDPIAFASGREVYGFAKTHGWMRPLADPRAAADGPSRPGPPDPPEELALDVYGVESYGVDAALGRRRLITIRRRGPVRGHAGRGASPPAQSDGADLASLITQALSELDPSIDPPLGAAARRSLGRRPSRTGLLAGLFAQQAVSHVFLKQIRDSERGEMAALQQVVEARSQVTGRSLRWRRLRGSYELSVASLASHPLDDELGLANEQTIRLAFVAEFGFRMEPGTVAWGAP